MQATNQYKQQSNF